MNRSRKILSACFLFVSTILAFTGNPAGAQTSKPILTVEVGTHSAGIQRIALDSSNRILVTGSDDKTVRVWDISGRGELLRILRPPANEEAGGRIKGLALSPDGDTVACGGFTGLLQKGDAWVYLFDRKTGAMIRRIQGLPGGGPAGLKNGSVGHRAKP